MKNVKISLVALYGILTILFLTIFTTLIILFFIVKIETYNQHLNAFERLYESISKFQYNTEKLLTTTNLFQHKKAWNESYNTLRSNLEYLDSLNIEHNHEQMKSYEIVISKEIPNINILLDDPLFSKKNTMDKSILRRLGEGLISNEKSDEYQLVTKLYDSIEYLKQYQEFLLDETSIQKNKNEIVVLDQISKMKIAIIVFPLVIFILSALFSYFIYRKIKCLEEDLIDSNNQLEESLGRIHDIVDTVPVRIFWKDTQGRYLGANNLLLQDAGLDQEIDILGKTDYDMPWKDTQAKDYIEDDKKVMESGEAKLHFEETQSTPDGKTITLLTSKVPLRNKSREIIGILGIYTDITKIRQMENDLKTKEKLMFQQSKMAAMGEMLENIAHQWRQPLSLISTSASGIQLQHQFKQLDDAYLLESMENILQSTQHLSDTINDFRDYFRPDKQKIEFTAQSIVDKSLMLLSSKYANREIEVVNKIEDIKFYGFENEFVQCVMNILKNASDALEKITDKKRIVIIETVQTNCCFNSINEECNDMCSKLIITDNAGGIPENIIDRVFEPYFTTKHQSQGTGIGLYMTKEMIEHHMNGSINVQNVEFEFDAEQHKGAQFIVSLPIKGLIE